MLIRVLYYDNKYDMVKPWVLDKLIELNYIQAFYRKTGWTYIGRDKTRGRGGGNYNGPERRRKENFLPYIGVSVYLALVVAIQRRL